MDSVRKDEKIQLQISSGSPVSNPQDLLVIWLGYTSRRDRSFEFAQFDAEKFKHPALK
jgi:hypothetical protein